MTKRIFRSICAVALVVLLAALVTVMGVMYQQMTIVQTSQLRVETALAAHAVANEGMDYFDRLDGTMNCRITWIAANGTVLYDNRSDSGAMENHLEREEVIEALASGFGQSIRYSNTLMERYIYAAERLPDNSVLRLSTAQNSVLTLVLNMAQPICIIVAAVLLLSLLLAGRLSQHIVKPLNDLNLDAPLANTGYAEILPLLHRLDYQQRQLQAQSLELRQKQKEFTTVTRALNEGLVLLSSTGTILSINPAAAKLLEITPNCVGADFSVANRNSTIAALTEKAFSGEKAEQPVAFSAGTYLAVASPVKTDGITSGVVLLLFDVTQKLQAEALRREFTANVSHELKTPLHTISGYAELIKNGIAQPGDIPGFSDKIYTEAQRMVRLVEDTLRLSRLDDGAEDMQWTDTDLFAVAREVVDRLSAPADLAGITLTLESKPTPLRCIPQLLQAIVFNLTDNAIKYNRPGGSVRIQVESSDFAIMLRVSDTGIGIPEAHQDRVFERFYRVDKSHSKNVGGTGLGLSIVKHAAQILGAKIQLDSKGQQGTTITVTFPRV